MSEAIAAPAGTDQTTAVAAPTTPSPETSATAPAVVPASEPAAPEAPPAVPEKYDFKSVEGKVDPSVLAKFEATAKQLGMTQDAAAKLLTELAPAVADAQKAHSAAQSSQWAEMARNDKELGGAKLQENLAIAKKALDAFGGPELVKVLNETGLGNHPELIRAFYKAGQKISLGTFVPAGQGAPQTSNASSKLYPSMK